MDSNTPYFCKTHGQAYFYKCPLCEVDDLMSADDPAPTQNPLTEEEATPPEDNTYVAIPEEKMRPHGEITSVLVSTPVSEAFKIADWVDKEIDFQLSAANQRIEELIGSAEGWESKYHQAEKEIVDLKEWIASHQ